MLLFGMCLLCCYVLQEHMGRSFISFLFILKEGLQKGTNFHFPQLNMDISLIDYGHVSYWFSPLLTSISLRFHSKRYFCYPRFFFSWNCIYYTVESSWKWKWLSLRYYYYYFPVSCFDSKLPNYWILYNFDQIYNTKTCYIYAISILGFKI